jgi:hypothetical protein
MVLPGHLAGGYLAARWLLAVFHPGFSQIEIDSLLIVGTLAGDLPDIDLAWYSFKHLVLKSQENDDHRQYISHSPLIWLGISSLVVLFGLIAGSIFTQFIGWMILCGTWSHFILDSIEHGVMWLWPISKKKLYLRDAPDPDLPGQKGGIKWYWDYIIKVYPYRITLYAEIVVTLAAIYLAFH